MQFKKSAVVGVLIVLYLTTDSYCLYISEKNSPTKNKTKTRSDQIQICGNALTTFIIEACDGIVGSLNQANASRNSVQTKITEDCCDQECPLDYLQSYCGKTPLFTFKKTLRGKLLSKLTRNRVGASEGAPENGKKKGVSEVRTREKQQGSKKGGQTGKKRKRSFKWKCAYKSFGHYLLKLERKGRARHNTAKGSNTINRTWPSLEIGTISPEMDKFGGQPIVVVKKNKSNSS